MAWWLADQTVRDASSYDEARARHAWKIPAAYSIADDICDRHADGRGRPALLCDANPASAHYTFDDLKRASDALAAGLTGLGVGPGARVAFMLPQVAEHALGLIAAFKGGAVAVPLSRLFGTDALRYRLGDSETAVLFTDGDRLGKVLEVWDDLPALRHVVLCDAAPGAPADRRVVPIADVPGRGTGSWRRVDTRAEDPALLIYTSGTTGPPKGALHAHRYLLGHNGVDYANNFFRPGDVYWSPADCAGPSPRAPTSSASCTRTTRWARCSRSARSWHSPTSTGP